ncbi:hypothetical protein NDU88_001629 [Pleurodeles waltl]|uniref:Uncharacterized protein n=1 Tax=Pleurodeles waltl TaxID=8319 RepID=A0AAV7W1K7_PLEWA|nr:hypothetical protein NDU88_001629 [Pleurodeles waltl]
MVEEIVMVEPQLFGGEVQQISIARKMELRRRIVDRVNIVRTKSLQKGRHKEDVEDLRGKVCSIAARLQLAIGMTCGGPPPTPPQLTAWEEQILAILRDSLE